MSSKYDKTIFMKFFKKKKTKNSGMTEIYGLHSVIAALNNTNRKHQKLAISQTHKSIITRKIKKNSQFCQIKKCLNYMVVRIHIKA